MNVQTIERFILDDLLQGGSCKALGLDEPLISSGVLDSLAMLKLIGFLEQELGLTIGDGEVVPENFETLRCILEFIDRKRPA
jgi:acyl carrier protein